VQNRIYKACLAAGPANPEAACPYTLDTNALVTKELLIGCTLLGVVALISVVIAKWRKRRATT
jgi:hypothetical protein